MSKTAVQLTEETKLNETQALVPVMSPELVYAEQAIAIEERKFALAQRQAKVYADSQLVPQHYRGNVGNVLIAQNMAKRMGADLLMVMQNLYVVHGNPGWSSQFLIATFNSNGRFSAVKYRFKGDENNRDEWGCQAYCTETAKGEEISGTWVTWTMATAEGWTTKTGSKWKTMPEQMFRYRSAAFLIRSTAPEIAMGLLTKEELEDMGDQASASMAERTKGKVVGLRERLDAQKAQDAEENNDQSEPTEVDYIDADILTKPADPDPEPDAEPVRAEESSLEDLITHCKDLLRDITGGRAREVAEILNGRKIDAFDGKQAKAFVTEMENLKRDPGI